MAYHVGSLVFDDWHSLPLDRGWSDTFVIQVSAAAGLPPMDYARVIRRILPPLAKLRRGASLWVQVNAPGDWYANELRRSLGRTPCPVAVTRGNIQPDASQFSFTVQQGSRPMTPPPKIAATGRGRAEMRFSRLQKKTLQVLARIQSGTVVEVASLAGISEKSTLGALRALVSDKLAEFIDQPPRKRPSRWMQRRKKRALVFRMKAGRRKARHKHSDPPHRKPDRPGSAELAILLAHLRKIRRKQFRTQPKHWWRITRAGKTQALRLWGIPAGVSFRAGMERDYLPGWRHVRTSRLAPAWIQRSGQAEVLGGWSEVGIPGYRVIPDALVWARVDGEEALVWVEVQGGSKPRQVDAFLRRMSLRFKRASEYSRCHQVRLVFLMLGKPWAIRVLREHPPALRQSEAMLLQTWLEYGKLPTILWGAMQSEGRL